MKFMLRLFLCSALVLTALNLSAQDEDATGCKDSTLIPRLPGSAIHSCENKEFDQAKMPMGADKDGNLKEKIVEGEYHYWDYGTREGMSEIQVFRNFETALKNAGFTIDFEESPGTITAHKGVIWYWLQNSGSYYYQTIVIEKKMQQEITADSLADEINKSGHVAVYGIHFDTGKATIQPDSENILGQIVTLLQAHPDLKLSVEGHTDSTGNAVANQTLSEKRAQAVVAWLSGKGIAASRLAAKGFGATKPVAGNGTEEGREKSRRVELVKM